MYNLKLQGVLLFRRQFVCCCAAEYVGADTVDLLQVQFSCTMYSLFGICAVNMLYGKTLNLTVTMFVCEQQSAAIYIHFATVCVISGKKITNMPFHVFFISFRSSSRNNCRNIERIFMKSDIPIDF
jgi:hypothetical protein